MSEYWIINLISVSVPLLSSFHPKLQFYKRWIYWFPAMIITAIVFLFWDAWFTSAGFWSFSHEYTAEARLVGMPLEEWAFFFCIPYACLFTFEAIKKLRPNFRVKRRVAGVFSVIIAALWVVGIALNINKTYTIVCFGLSLPLLGIVWYNFPDILRRYLPVFLILLVPFVLVNGLLTGSFSAMEIVSYNDTQNMGIRFLRIPLEDFSYAFSMILMSLLFIRFFEEIFSRSQS